VIHNSVTSISGISLIQPLAAPLKDLVLLHQLARGQLQLARKLLLGILGLASQTFARIFAVRMAYTEHTKATDMHPQRLKMWVRPRTNVSGLPGDLLV
jgi:hypothetical protein